MCRFSERRRDKHSPLLVKTALRSTSEEISLKYSGIFVHTWQGFQFLNEFVPLFLGIHKQTAFQTITDHEAVAQILPQLCGDDQTAFFIDAVIKLP